MDLKTSIFITGEKLDKLLSGEPLEITLEAQCRAPVVAYISIKKPTDTMEQFLKEEGVLE